MGIVYIFIACFIWALDTLIRYPLLYKFKSSEVIVFGEHLFLTIIFLPFLISIKDKIKAMTRAELFSFFMIGGMGSAVATLAFTKSFALINPSLVILLQKLQPIVAITLAFFILGESLSKRFLLWALIALVGAGMISYVDIETALDLIVNKKISFDRSAIYGIILALVSVISWGSATVFGKSLIKSGWQEREVMAIRFSLGFIVSIPFFIYSLPSFNAAFYPLQLWGNVSILALISGVGGMYFYYKGLGKISAKACTIAEMSFPFFAVIINWVALGKELSTLQIIGGIILLTSSTMIQLDKRK